MLIILVMDYLRCRQTDAFTPAKLNESVFKFRISE